MKKNCVKQQKSISMLMIRPTSFLSNTQDSILEYIQQHIPCKFRTKSGKVIYGIILERYDDEKRENEYFFTSIGETISKGKFLSDIQYCRKHTQSVKLEDIIFAEELRLVA